MATTSNIKNLRESHQGKVSHSSRASHDSESLNERKGKHSPLKLMQETARYEKYSKYWSILSNVAAIVSVSGAIFAMIKKRRWF